jgi:hypothetical protein
VFKDLVLPADKILDNGAGYGHRELVGCGWRTPVNFCGQDSFPVGTEFNLRIRLGVRPYNLADLRWICKIVCICSGSGGVHQIDNALDIELVECAFHRTWCVGVQGLPQFWRKATYSLSNRSGKT